MILSTDSQDYADIGARYGALVPGLRSAQASSDTAMEEDIIADLTQSLPARGIPVPDVWIRLKPTNPFRRIAAVQEGLHHLKNDPTIESVRIVSPADPRLVRKNDSGFLEPVLKDIWDPKRSVMRRTEFPDAYSPFNLDLFRHKNWETMGSGYMGRNILPIVDHAITGLDINDGDDFDIVKAMIEMRPRPDIVMKFIVPPTR